MEAIVAATRDGGALMGLGDQLGQVRPGYLADLLLVDGDPEAKIGDLRHVDQVMSDGVLMDGDALRTEAGFSGKPK